MSKYLAVKAHWEKSFKMHGKACQLEVSSSLNRPFEGQGHVTMSIIKIGGSTKRLSEMN